MSFDTDILYKILQILGISAAVVMALVTGIRYINRRVMKDVKDFLQPCFDKIEADEIESNRRISLLEQAVEFVKEFFMRNRDRDEKYGDNDGKHKGEGDN